jgi:hypothetical protein
VERVTGIEPALSAWELARVRLWAEVIALPSLLGAVCVNRVSPWHPSMTGTQGARIGLVETGEGYDATRCCPVLDSRSSERAGWCHPAALAS